MNSNVQPEKYRKLSITALVTGIISVSIVALYNFLWLLQLFLEMQLGFIFIISTFYMPVIFLLSIVAIVCGSIDLKRMKAGLYSKKGKGFDIAGIILGGASFILFAIFFLLGEIIVPH